jgi:hypothetical protein
MTRADRSLIRQCILDAAQRCVADQRTVLTRDVRDALRERRDPTLPEMRRVRLLEMADAMDMFCQGTDGEMFDRPARRGPRPTSPSSIWRLAREGYNAQLSIAYISLINTVNNIAERDQFLGRPIINVTDEGHIITPRTRCSRPTSSRSRRCKPMPGTGWRRRTSTTCLARSPCST